MSAANVHVLIVGSGVFGASTALHLLRDPAQKYSVTILDKAPVLPAPDAASTDINKIVRSSYSDIWYTRLAQEAITAWKSDKIYQDAYHESGVVLIGNKLSGLYSSSAYQNDVSQGCRIETFSDATSAKTFFPDGTAIGDVVREGFINRDGGWAYAAGGVNGAMAEVERLGARVLPGRSVVDINYDLTGKATGVKLKSGEDLPGDIVVIATGSWTPSTFAASTGVHDKLISTGQSIATIQLSPEQVDLYRQCPVVLDFNTGFYVFPPNSDGVMKFAIHHAGYINPQPMPQASETHVPSSEPTLVSTPRTITSHPDSGLRIPVSMAQALRDGLRGIYPALADVPFSGTRMCWYCDTPDADWLIDYHADHPGLLFATGGSGHAYKFLPVIGALVKARIEGALDPDTSKRFAFRKEITHEDGSRVGQRPLVLREEDLAT